MADQGEFLTSTEKKLLAHGAAFERAKAISEVAQLREALLAFEETAGRIRVLDEPTARELGNAAMGTRRLIEALDSSVEAAPPVALPETEPAKESVILPAAPMEMPEAPAAESEPSGMLTTRAYSYLKKLTHDDLNDLTAEDAALIPNVLASFRGPMRVMKTARLDYGQILDQYLIEGLSLSEIAETSGSTPASISQTLRKIIQDTLKKNGDQPIELRALIERAKRLQTEHETEQPTQPEAPVVVAEVEAQPAPVIPIESALSREEPEAAEDLSDEPRHVRITEQLSERIEFDGPQKAALKSILDPKGTTEMNLNKQTAVDKIKKAIRAGSGLNEEKYQLTPQERKWMYDLLGLVNFYEPARDQPGTPLSSLLRTVRNDSQKPQVIEAVHTSLEKVFGLTSKTAEGAERTGTDG